MCSTSTQWRWNPWLALRLLPRPYLKHWLPLLHRLPPLCTSRCLHKASRWLTTRGSKSGYRTHSCVQKMAHKHEHCMTSGDFAADIFEDSLWCLNKSGNINLFSRASINMSHCEQSEAINNCKRRIKKSGPYDLLQYFHSELKFDLCRIPGQIKKLIG